MSLAVSIYARHDRKILLIRHRRLGQWLPVGGSVEPGESPLDAAKRELLEETGLVGRFQGGHERSGKPKCFLAYSEIEDPHKGLQLVLSFVAEVDTDKITPNEEFDQYKWLSNTYGVACPENVRQILPWALQSCL